MPEDFGDVEVVCPFYNGVRNDMRQMKCDEIFDSCRIVLEFKTKKALNLHRKLFCNDLGRYKKCEMYRLIEEMQSLD